MELLLPVLLVAAFWLFIIRPQRNRARELARVQGALTPGQTVMTGGGLFATVAAVDDDEVLLEVAPGVQSRYSRQAVVRVVDDPTAPDADRLPAEPGSDLLGDPERRDDDPTGGRQ